MEDHPTYQNLVGRVDHIAQLGTLVTDFNLVKAGALHRANGGYLLLDVLKVLMQPFAWEGLKRAITRREIRIESISDMYGMASTVSLEPEPIPLDIKVVLFGERIHYYLLQAYDPDFKKLFRVAADFEETIDRSEGNSGLFVRLIATVARQNDAAAGPGSGGTPLNRLGGGPGRDSLYNLRTIDLLSGRLSGAQADAR
jgi:predicted ATP-dependent protease